MRHSPPAKTKNLGMMPCRKIEVKNDIKHILHLPSGQRIITHSGEDGSFQVWDLERGTRVREEWEDKERGVTAIALSPDGKTVASGSKDGAVKLWNVDMGKIIKTWPGHTNDVRSVCWSPNGERVVSGGYWDGTFSVWDVKSGEVILGPIQAGQILFAVCYSPDGKMIATSSGMEIWDANTGKLLKTFKDFLMCPAWTLDGKTLIAGRSSNIIKFDIATWTEIAVVGAPDLVSTISLSPNERILATTVHNMSNDAHKTAQLWNLKTNQPIGTPLDHSDLVNSATFSADGKFLITSCNDGDICTWDLSTIIKEADLLSNNADATPRPTPKMKGARRIPPGLFEDTLREANLRVRLSQSHRTYNHPTPAPRQPTLSRLSSFWCRFKPRNTQPPSHPLSWARNLVSGTLHRRHRSDIELREPPVVEVPCTAGKPRNYHAKKKPAVSPSRPSNIHIAQQPSGAAQSIPSSSQQPPPTVAGAGITGAISRPHITGTGWRAHFIGWVCCIPIQNADGEH